MYAYLRRQQFGIMSIIKTRTKTQKINLSVKHTEFFKSQQLSILLYVKVHYQGNNRGSFYQPMKILIKTAVKHKYDIIFSTFLYF